MAPPLANLRSSLGQTKDYKILTKELASQISKYEPSYFYLIDCSHKTMYSDFYIWKYHPTNAINLVLFFLQDSALKSSLPVIELIDAMRSGVIKSEFVIKSSGELGEEVSSHFHYWSINSQLVKIGTLRLRIFSSFPPLRRMQGSKNCGFFRYHFYFIDVLCF